jgi:hypothetical protein
LKTKHKYSRQVRLVGYCIIVLEVLGVFTWAAAFYGNTATLATTALSALNLSSGHGFSMTNTTAGVVLTAPITGVGFFPVTISATAKFLNAQNQTVSQSQDSVTVSPGETKNLSVTIPSSIVQSTSSLSSYHIKVNLEVMSLYNLVSIKGDTVINSSALGGGKS